MATPTRSRSRNSRGRARSTSRRFALLLIGLGLAGLALFVLLSGGRPTAREEIDEGSREQLEAVLREHGADP